MKRVQFLKAAAMATFFPATAVAASALEDEADLPEYLSIHRNPEQQPRLVFGGHNVMIGEPGAMFIYWKSEDSHKRHGIYNLNRQQAKVAVKRIIANRNASYREILAGMPNAIFADEMDVLDSMTPQDLT